MGSLRLPLDLMTLADWDALPPDESLRKAELVEGVLQVSPSPVSDYQLASGLLFHQLHPVLSPQGWAAVQDIDVVLVASFPPTVRAPDLSIVRLADARLHPKRYDASRVRVAIEVVSPGSARKDRIVKLAEYAEAGIPDYWIITLGEKVTLDAFRMYGATYRLVIGAATGVVELDVPVPLSIDLAALVP